MGSQTHCVPSCGQEEKAHFADALYKRAQLTWAQLRQAPSHGLGFEMIPRFRIKVPIPSTITEDVTKFMVFRCSGSAPMVGYRDGATFHILWIDHDFRVYDH
jgi:hypothetical protein